MILNEKFVVAPFPFNLVLPKRSDFAHYQQYSEQKKSILNQVIIKFLAQNSENLALLYPKTLLETPTQNPTNLTNPYWQWLVRNNVSAYDLSHTLKLEQSQPFWSLGRMGQTCTLLPDGREILIGGEFEDDYDPLFWIYNDVIIKYPDGNIEIFGYPRHIFAPTDFHTTTLVGNEIWIIGSLGYGENRQTTQTSVYKLNIHTYKIEKVETRNSMGWVHHHSATLKDNQIIVTGGEIWLGENMPIVENFDDWSLNLKTLIWKNISKKQWQCFYVQRKDNDYLHLSNYKMLLGASTKQGYENALSDFIQTLGQSPNWELYDSLLKPPIAHEPNNDSVLSIFIEGIKVRYVENDDNIQVYIEGILSPHKLELLQENLRHKLSKLENFACEVKELVF